MTEQRCLVRIRGGTSPESWSWPTHERLPRVRRPAASTDTTASTDIRVAVLRAPPPAFRSGRRVELDDCAFTARASFDQTSCAATAR